MLEVFAFGNGGNKKRKVRCNLGGEVVGYAREFNQEANPRSISWMELRRKRRGGASVCRRSEVVGE